jgi:hypothetical protein
MGGVVEPTIYTDRYVAFVDILGFSSIVQRSVRDEQQAAELAQILERISNRASPSTFNLQEGDDFKAQSFSDCTVISEKASAKGLLHLTQVVSFLSLDLLASGVLVRGGIAKGPLHHRDKVVFGPALIEAYGLESRTAKFPRILLDRGTHTDFTQLDVTGQDPHLRPSVKLDSDGPPFLDFFATFRALSDRSPERLHTIVRSCRAHIQGHLNDAIYEPSVFEKLRWLAIYWNSTGAGLQPVVFPTR